MVQQAPRAELVQNMVAQKRKRAFAMRSSMLSRSRSGMFRNRGSAALGGTKIRPKRRTSLNQGCIAC